MTAVLRDSYTLEEASNVLTERLKDEFSINDIIGYASEDKIRLSILLKFNGDAYQQYKELVDKAKTGNKRASKELEEIDTPVYFAENGESNRNAAFVIARFGKDSFPLHEANRYVRLHDKRGVGRVEIGYLLMARENLIELLTGNKIDGCEHLDRRELFIQKNDLKAFIECYKKHQKDEVEKKKNISHIKSKNVRLTTCTPKQEEEYKKLKGREKHQVDIIEKSIRILSNNKESKEPTKHEILQKCYDLESNLFKGKDEKIMKDTSFHQIWLKARKSGRTQKKIC